MNTHETHHLPSELIFERMDSVRDDLHFETWRESMDTILQLVEHLEENENNKELAHARMSFILEDISTYYAKEGRNIEELKRDILSYFNSKKDVPKILKHPTKKTPEKRKPNFPESIEATLDRLEAIVRVEKIFEKNSKGIIVGGSLSYGPYYNVRSKSSDSESSDVDIIIILKDDVGTCSWESLLHTDLFSEQDKKVLLKRLEIFSKDYLPNNKADMLSQKVDVVGVDFYISIHVVDEKGIDTIAAPVTNHTDGISLLKDYRRTPFKQSACINKGFDGDEIIYKTGEQKPVEEGVVVELPSHATQKGRYYPGLYQFLLIPKFSILYDEKGEITEKINNFKESVVDYVKENYGEEDIEKIIQSSHIRDAFFAPGLEDEV